MLNLTLLCHTNNPLSTSMNLSFDPPVIHVQAYSSSIHVQTSSTYII